MPVVAAVAPFAPIIGGALGLAGTIGGSLISASAAKKAGATQAAAAGDARNLIAKQFETTREDLSPFRQMGMNAMSSLADLYGFGGKGPAFSKEALGGFLESPEYTFGYNQGIKGVQASAAAKGMLQSPAALQGIYKFGSDYTTNAIGGYIGNLLKMAGMGEQAASGTAQFGASAAAQQAGLLTEQGAATASGTVGEANSITKGIGGVLTLGNQAFGQGGYLSAPSAPAMGTTFSPSAYMNQSTNTLTGIY